MVDTGFCYFYYERIDCDLTKSFYNKVFWNLKYFNWKSVIEATMIYTSTFHVQYCYRQLCCCRKYVSSNLKTNDFLIFTELLTKRINNESVVELNKTDQFVPAAKKRIKMWFMGGCPKQNYGFSWVAWNMFYESNEKCIQKFHIAKLSADSVLEASSAKYVTLKSTTDIYLARCSRSAITFC